MLLVNHSLSDSVMIWVHEHAAVAVAVDSSTDVSFANVNDQQTYVWLPKMSIWGNLRSAHLCPMSFTVAIHIQRPTAETQ